MINPKLLSLFFEVVHPGSRCETDNLHPVGNLPGHNEGTGPDRTGGT
jgi:hypothetical protein